VSMVPARDPRTCPLCREPLQAGCHACPGPPDGRGWLYRRSDDGDPGRADYVRFFRLDAFDRLLIETFRDGDLEPPPELAALLELPDDELNRAVASWPGAPYDAEAGLRRLEAWMNEDIPEGP